MWLWSKKPRGGRYGGRPSSNLLLQKLRVGEIFKPVAEMAFMRGMLHDFPRVVNTAPESPNFWYNLAMPKAIDDVATIMSDK